MLDRAAGRTLAVAILLAAPASGCSGVSGPSELPAPSPTEVVTTPRPPAATPEPSCQPAAGRSAPAARGYHAMVDLPGDGVLMVSGGPNPESDFFADTWHFSPMTGWAAVAACPNVDVTDHAAFDAGSNRVYAGVGATWLFEPGSSEWERLAIGGPPFEPGSRSAYDSESGRIVLYAANGSTWVLDLVARSWMGMAAVGPPARGWGGIAYDTSVDRVVLFGGSGAGDVHLADTWSYDVAADRWLELDPQTRPPGRTYAAMTYVPPLRGSLLFGGAIGPWEAETVLADMWLFGHESESWTEIRPGRGPSPRAWHAMAFDAESGLVVLFGGGPDRRRYTEETWLFEPTAGTWREWSAP